MARPKVDKDMKRISVGIRMEPSLHKELSAIAEEQARPFANLLNFALQEWVDSKKSSKAKK